MEPGKMHLAALAAIMAQATTLTASQPQEALSPWVMSYVNIVVCDYFASNLDKIAVKPLAGGYSEATNVLLHVAGTAYVLRVMSESDAPLKRNTEAYATKQAGLIATGPQVHWISPDGVAILMDYIVGGTITLQQAKTPEMMFKVADLMRKVHALPKNFFYAPSFEAQMEEFYDAYGRQDGHHDIWDGAISIIKEGALQLQRLNAPNVNTHGDLNPRNVLVSSTALYFIDWGDGMYTDPFQDLSFFSIMMDYDAQEEARFLQCYLEHIPTLVEKKRFRIAKKMNFARLVLSGQGIGNQLWRNQKDAQDAQDAHESLREWSYYAQVFADGNTPLSAQFFWGQAKVALEAAKALDVNVID